MEITAAGAVLAVLLTVSLQMLAATAARRRAVEDRQTALVEAANAMERLAAVPWEEVTDEDLAEMQLSEPAQKVLRRGTLAVDVRKAGGEPEAKRIAVTVAWQDGSGNPQRPVTLVAWRYRAGFPQPNEP